ncbi:MAG: aminotransferase class I/II-fold pyridoxal phosphate-dependent enzyme, partial [Phycisphaerae bacterium]
PARAQDAEGVGGAGLAEESRKRFQESFSAVEKKTPGTFFVRVGTLSKALGGVGGFVAASRDVIDLLVNRARPFIYTTALPAAACEAARQALRILRAEPDRRTRLHALARTLRTRLRDDGFDLGTAASEEADAAAPPTPIVPVLFGEPERALSAAAALLERGIFCPAVRPPTVPAGTSRLRVSLTAGHTEEDVERLVAALLAARDAV